MRVKKLLDKKGRDVHSVSPDTTVYEALKVMAEKETRVLVVLKKGKVVVGVMSERDYARKVILKGRSSKDTLVKDIMTSDIISVSQTTKLKKCYSLMLKNNIHQLPVIDDGELVGIISINDIRLVS